ncbi:MAG TPA: ABC-type transport auxiliary lipoprotein family protein [Gammaproteobacteria bacterium]
MIEVLRRYAYAVVLPALLLAGCGGVARVPEDSFYRLNVATPATRAAAPALADGLVVQGGAAAPLYRDRAFLYSEPNARARLQRYHYHYWTDSPPQLVQRGLADYLRAAGVAAPVLLPEDGTAARNRLRVDIERFEHVRGAGNGQAEVALRITLTARDRGVLLQESLHAEAPVAGADFTAVAAAYEQVLAELYGRIAGRLAALN